MRRFVVLLVCLMLLPCAVANADYSFVKTNYISQMFQMNDNVESWVESTEYNRMVCCFCAISDIGEYDPTYDARDNEMPLFLIGVDAAHNKFVHMYIRNMSDTYLHITLCPSWTYMIYEETGIPEKTARENLSKVAKTVFEITIAEVSEFLAQNDSNNNSSTEAPSPTVAPQSNKVENKTVVSGLPSLSGPFSGKKVSIKVNDKTYTIRQDFKSAMDKYCEFFDSYINFAKSLDKQDPSYLTKYADLMQKYYEVVQALEYMDNIDNDDLTIDEMAYLLYVVTDVNTRLLSVLN